MRFRSDAKIRDRVLYLKPSKENCEVSMPDYDAMKEILGKTVQGVIVKKNLKRGSPAMSLHLVLDDGTYYEIYTDYHLSFAGGLNQGNMAAVRKYGIAPMGPMENVLDISVDQAE
jgi:hypothetical protein